MIFDMDNSIVSRNDWQGQSVAGSFCHHEQVLSDAVRKRGVA
jgi:hypothetical protein